MRSLLVVAFLLLVALFIAMAGRASTPASASFHVMRIYGVMGGADGSASVQFVELREAAAGQGQVQNAQLCFYDADGLPWARFVFPGSVPSGAKDGSILVGSAAMETAWNAGGASLDFTFSAANTTALNGAADVNAPIPAHGTIVYESKTDTTCTMPEQTGPIDWFAYGATSPTFAFFGSVFPHDLATDGSGFQLKTTPVAFPPTNNSTEYAVVDCIVARNNAGQSGTVGGGACGPSGELMGDADCDGDVDAADGLAALDGASGLGAIPCTGRADVNCDSANNAVDALGIYRYLAGVPISVNGCTQVGQPLPG